MRRMAGLALLALGIAVPVHAQGGHAGGAAGSGGMLNSGAGGLGGGGLGSGSTAGSKPPSTPPAHFNLTSASGSPENYVPSTFLSYEQALVAAQGLPDAPPPAVAEVARQQAGAAHGERAKVALVQDGQGRAIILRR